MVPEDHYSGGCGNQTAIGKENDKFDTGRDQLARIKITKRIPGRYTRARMTG
jgi:hypothetical protein